MYGAAAEAPPSTCRARRGLPLERVLRRDDVHRAAGVCSGRSVLRPDGALAASSGTSVAGRHSVHPCRHTGVLGARRRSRARRAARLSGPTSVARGVGPPPFGVTAHVDPEYIALWHTAGPRPLRMDQSARGRRASMSASVTSPRPRDGEDEGYDRGGARRPAARRRTRRASHRSSARRRRGGRRPPRTGPTRGSRRTPAARSSGARPVRARLRRVSRVRTSALRGEARPERARDGGRRGAPPGCSRAARGERGRAGRARRASADAHGAARWRGGAGATAGARDRPDRCT